MGHRREELSHSEGGAAGTGPVSLLSLTSNPASDVSPASDGTLPVNRLSLTSKENNAVMPCREGMGPHRKLLVNSTLLSIVSWLRVSGSLPLKLLFGSAI